MASFGADLTLICDVTRTDPDGSQYTGQRRFEYSWESGTLIVSQNYGGGWRSDPVARFQRADDTRIVNSDNANTYSVIDRTTGEYVFKSFTTDGPNDPYPAGTTIKGMCHKAEAGNRKF